MEIQKLTGNEQMHPIVKPGVSYSDGSYEETLVSDGLTIRQYFAAMAKTPDFILRKVHDEYDNDDTRIKAVAFADALYKREAADALITELNKQYP